MEWLIRIVPLLASAFVFIYGVLNFFGKKDALYLKLFTAAMGCFSLGTLHSICIEIVAGTEASGFFISYFGHVGCFLFLLSANYGQIDGLIDDGNENFRKYRYIALIAPAACLLFGIFSVFAEIKLPIKVIYLAIWLFISLCSYYNFKHLIIPDMGFVFVKAIRPFNASVLVFSAMEMVYLAVKALDYLALESVMRVLIGISCIAMLIFAKKGVKQWTI